ncbi:MAG: hypothetical protein RHS_1407 [Robinsoniella sp. RHS]|uniref:hypothetical protein n=1 Tax=Robinsoniella sp. RHS TaxID=1504536 RepID=UPI000658291A|nr:MAG: hypothetical protein RHS_1407 [Robinsoniella sp. RHS]
MYGKMGVGNWHGLRQLAAELVFSNLSEDILKSGALFSHLYFQSILHTGTPL